MQMYESNTNQMTAINYSAYIQLMRMDRPIGTFLLLWPTLWALWLAGNGQPDPTIVIIFVLGTIVMRAAGCVINDYADRNLDPHVERTMNRPLASGALSTTQALVLFSLLLCTALVLVLLLNPLARYLSVIAALLAILYPFSKRFTHLPQCILGLAFSMGIPMAYAALMDAIPIEAWILFAANFLWIVAYDTQYAMVDRDDDLLIGVKSTAILFGQFDNIVIAGLQAGSIGLLALTGWLSDLSWHFYIGLSIAIILMLYQQYLCKDKVRENCLRAFLNNNWVGAGVFFGIVLGLVNSSMA
jgi:4-hydroxybenzoate polyprenyltransferase